MIFRRLPDTVNIIYLRLHVNANIVTIYKRKGDKAICGNSRGISLLSVAGKVLVDVTLVWFLTHIW